MTDPELLRMIGEAMFGPHWPRALASHLEVSPDTLRKWMHDHRPIPVGIWAELENALMDRAMLITKAGATLSALRP